MKLLIVIVNYRSAQLTIDCLGSLKAGFHSSAPVEKTGSSAIIGDRLVDAEIAPLCSIAHVIVTDNHSPDDSVEKLQAAVRDRHWTPLVTIQPLAKNGGFACGNNAAIAPALAGNDKPEFILLLNPDTIVRPGAITALLNFMQASPKVGIAGSRLEDPDGTPQRSAF
jgi:N-acetylglucosaminyl-diphospho-decaprenol L-rhamnosyltransferase